MLSTLALQATAACVGPSPVDLPRDHNWMVAVSSVRIPDDMEWYARFAHHTWIDIKQGGDDAWTRIEV